MPQAWMKLSTACGNSNCGLSTLNEYGALTMPIKKVSTFAFCLFAASLTLSAQEPDRGWKDYGGGPDNTRFFPGKQITKANVNKLKVAWNYPYATAGASTVIA